MIDDVIRDLLESLSENPPLVHETGARCWCRPVVQRFCPACRDDDRPTFTSDRCATCDDVGAVELSPQELEQYDGSFELIIVHHCP